MMARAAMAKRDPRRAGALACGVVLVLMLVGAALMPDVELVDPSGPLVLEGHGLQESPARRRSIVIAGLFKDNGPKLERMYELMKATARPFDEHLIVFFENDSKDGTSAKLRAICKSDPRANCINLLLGSQAFQYMPEVDHEGGPFSQARFARMALYRNMVLEHVRRLRKFDYFVFVDPDMYEQAWLPDRREIAGCGLERMPARWGGPARGWDPLSVLGSIHDADKKGMHWSAICSYGTFSDAFMQYDTLAFRLSERTPIPEAARRAHPGLDAAGWNERFSAPAIREGRSSDKNLHCGMFEFSYAAADGFVPAASCFGGLTIYSLPALRESGCAYDEAAQDCEHVSLHSCLLEHQPDSIFLDARARVYYDSESRRREASSLRRSP